MDLSIYLAVSFNDSMTIQKGSVAQNVCIVQRNQSETVSYTIPYKRVKLKLQVFEKSVFFTSPVQPFPSLIDRPEIASIH